MKHYEKQKIDEFNAFNKGYNGTGGNKLKIYFLFWLIEGFSTQKWKGEIIGGKFYIITIFNYRNEFFPSL